MLPGLAGIAGFNATAAGGGGGGSAVNQYSTHGNALSSNPGVTFSTTDKLVAITPTNTIDVSHITLGYFTSSGQSAKAIIYTDSAGAPNALVAVGSATSLGTVTSTPTLIDCPFSSPVTLTGGVTYWIGIVTSGSISWSDTNGLGSTSWTGSVTYASPQATITGISALSRPVMFAKGERSAVLAGADLIATGTFVSYSNTSRPGYYNIPQWAVGDVVFLQLNHVTNGGGGPTPTTPTGFTLISSPGLNNSALFNGSNLVYMRVMDGTESGVVVVPTVANNVLCGQVSVFRGMNVSGTPYEGLTTSFGSSTSNVSPAITTTGSNRLGVNFFANGNAPGCTMPDTSDTWTDGYYSNTTAGRDADIAVSYKDAPTATTMTTETRTSAVSTPYAVVSLALIRI